MHQGTNAEEMVKAFETILSHTCPSGPYPDEDNPYRTFRISTCCVDWNVRAKSLGWDEEAELGHYDIVALEVVKYDEQGKELDPSWKGANG